MQHNLQHKTPKGPKPLPLHLSMAAAACASAKRAGDTHWHDYRDMLAGIQRYHACDSRRDTQHLKAVATISSSTLYAHTQTLSGDDTAHPPLLLIPSMINGSEIFDIVPDCSLLAYLNHCGIPAYLLDWGDVLHDPGLQDFTEIAQRLNALASEIANQYNVRSIHGLGYCMGGHFLAAGNTLDPRLYKSLTFLSTPWNFAAPHYRLAELAREFAPAICANLSVSDYLSPQWLHSIFALIEPDQALRKFAKFAAMPENSHEASLFVAIEDWLNSTVALPHDLAWTIVTQIVQRNALARGVMDCDGVPVQPGAMHQPAHIIAPQHDKLATPESVHALYRDMPNAELYTPDCGHIAPMCDRGVQHSLWPGIVDKLITMDNR